MEDIKGFKFMKMVKNDLKQTGGLTELEFDLAAYQILVTREGEKHPQHTLKSVGEWTLNRKKKNETYNAMAGCLNSTPPYFGQLE